MSLSKARKIPTLETQRLRLRELAISDAPAFLDIHSD